MGKPYAAELERLRETYSWALACDISSLRSAVSASKTLPLVAIGSGGSLTSAHILSSLHQKIAQKLSTVSTPLEIASCSADPLTANWLLTAGGGNVDILTAFNSLVKQEPAQLAILCTKLSSPLEMEASKHPFVDFVSFDLPTGKDGFLATNSLLATSVLLTRAYLEEFCQTDKQLNEVDNPIKELLSSDELWRSLQGRVKPLLSRDTLIVLYGPQTKAGAIDLEAKFTEAALGNIQIVDYRNFGHGRHCWLAKRGGSSSIIALTCSADKTLAQKTLELLPKDIPVARIYLAGNAEVVAISSLLAAFKITGWAGEIRQIDPGQPGVPSFGESLYSLTVDIDNEQHSVESKEGIEQLFIQRKTGKPKKDLCEVGTWGIWVKALDEFRQNLSKAEFSGVVLDYDGTIVETKSRYDAPQSAIISELIRLLNHGIYLGIATGRGRSVRHELQKCLPQELWNRVIIGYYNGAEIGRLYENEIPNNQPEVCPDLQQALASLNMHQDLNSIAKVTSRPYQVTFEQKKMSQENYLWEVINQTLVENNVTNVTLLRSSHSVDVLAPGVSKIKVIDAVRLIAGEGSEVLKIGDRGRWPGNDCFLLNEPFSLSVDECNMSYSTCWNLGGIGQRGAHITLEYLQKLKHVDGTKKMSFG